MFPVSYKRITLRGFFAHVVVQHVVLRQTFEPNFEFEANVWLRVKDWHVRHGKGKKSMRVLTQAKTRFCVCVCLCL